MHDVHLFVTICLVISAVSVVAVTACYPVHVVVVLLGSILAWRYRHRVYNKTLSCKDRYTVITGCDTGFGHHLANYLDTIGCNVIAGCYVPNGDGAQRLKKSSSNRLNIVELDVSSDESVGKFFEKTKQILGNNDLWGIVNNAGIQFNGEVELLPMQNFHSNMEVNYFGAVRMCKRFIPILRKSKGRIVNVASVLSYYAIRNTATYTPTKAALSLFSDILRREVKRFGIKVSVIKPGSYSDVTNILQLEQKAEENKMLWKQCPPEVREVYTEKYVLSLGMSLKEDLKSAGANDLSYVTQAIADALFSSRPQIRYLVDGRGFFLDKYTWAARLQAFLPDALTDILATRFL